MHRVDDVESRLARAEAQVRELRPQIAALEAGCDEGDRDSEDLVRMAEL